MSSVAEILVAEERSMGQPVKLLSSAKLGEALCVLYETESEPIPGGHVLVQRRLAVWTPDSKTSLVVSSEWREAAKS